MGMTGEQAADEVLALGSTNPEEVVQAADGVAELVRRLNHATFHPQALLYPSSVGLVAARINAAVWGLEQLLGQLARRADLFAADGRLYHDQAGDDHGAAVDAAQQAAVKLRRASRAGGALMGPLHAAVNLLGHRRSTR